MTETPAGYHTGDPGDESTSVATYPASHARCWQCGKLMPIKATPEICPACHHLNFVRNPVSRAPSAEEMAAAIREYSRSYRACAVYMELDGEASPLYGPPSDTLWWELCDAKQAAVAILHQLAARLPGGRGIDG